MFQSRVFKSQVSKVAVAALTLAAQITAIAPAHAQGGYPPRDAYGNVIENPGYAPAQAYPQQSYPAPAQPYAPQAYSPEVQPYAPQAYSPQAQPYAPQAVAPAPTPDQQAAYANAAQNWAQANCVKSHGDIGAGAVIGGIFGAIVGSSFGGRHDHGDGAVAGAIIGSVGGAAIAASDEGTRTSVGCPPGYVLRQGGVSFSTVSYGVAPLAFVAGYNPWFWVGNRWTYRPYANGRPFGRGFEREGWHHRHGW
jgi:hypothetical protein